jgi:hypothetical protein
MTQAQKIAKEKFKKAIAYRTKTGVSLKEAFAHIYGKKVGVIKKKVAPKKKAAVKKIGAVKKKSENKYKYFIQDSEAGNVIDKYITLSEAKKDLLKFEKDDKKEGIYKQNFYEIKSVNNKKNVGNIKKKAAPKKKASTKKINGLHNKSIVSGVGNIVSKTMKDISDTKKIIIDQSELLERLQQSYKKMKNKENKELLMMDIKTLKNNFIPHNKRYLKSLQVSLKKSI